MYKKHSIKSFSDIDNTNDKHEQNTPFDIISFLHLYREKIDPKKELSIYENSPLTADRQDVSLFVNQLTIINSWREKQRQQQDEGSNNREIPLSKDQLSAVEKAVQHKFGVGLSTNRTSQLIKKAKNYSKKTRSIIQYARLSLFFSSINVCLSIYLVTKNHYWMKLI